MRKLLILISVIAFSVASFAGDAARKGTSGADQLLVPVGARSIATAGAFLGDVSGVEAIYYNPAGLGTLAGTQAMFDYTQYFADINVSYLAVGSNLGEMGTIALTYKSIGFGDIPITDYANPDGTGQTYSPSYITAGLTYAKALTDRVVAGVNFKVIHEGILNTGATGWALDFGVQYHFNKNLSIGVAVANIGDNMKYSGSDLQVKLEPNDVAFGSGNAVYEAVTEEFQIPSYFEFSGSYKFFLDENNYLGFAGTFRNNNNMEDLMRVGVEYSFMDMMFIRGGYNYQLENSDDYIYSWATGAGVKWEMLEGVTIMFDYAYRAVEFEGLTDTHIFTLTLGAN